LTINGRTNCRWLDFTARLIRNRSCPRFCLHEIPAGLRGMIVVAMFTAIRFCKYGLVNQASGLFVRDIYQNFLRPAARNREEPFPGIFPPLGWWSRVFYFGGAANSINDLRSWIIMSFTVGSLAPALFRLCWWRCSAWGTFLHWINVTPTISPVNSEPCHHL
jgi:SSS family solute:Na+ symporter